MSDILIVDDSKAVRQQLRVILQSEGYKVQEAIDGAEGLKAARTGHFDLIIADVNMPNMNGIEMVKAIRDGGLKDTPIFMLTTEGRATVAREGKNAGANAWIVKPFKAPQLLEAVQRACSGPHSRSGRS